jgi:anti-sigma factor RsiW
MAMNDDQPLDDSTLQAWVDGRLPPEARAAVDRRIEADPQLALHAAALASQLESLRGLHREVLQEPVPAALAEAARRVGREGARLDGWQRWGGMAAAVLLAFGVGWASHAQWDMARGTPLARARPVTEFGRQAVVAHVVFSPEVRHPVEVPAAEQDHLVRWLSKRLGRPLKVPDLTSNGYELVGGRLLSGGDGPRAQFMYQTARGDRITLYVGALEAAHAQATAETAFRFTSEGGTSSFYWVDQGFGYALAGRLGRAELQALADLVYKQL